jgi:hypothetical protein
MQPEPLHRAFPSRYGAPVISAVDPRIFRLTYFTRCLQCPFCHDACCDHGVDVDQWHVERVAQHADALQAYVGVPRQRWFTARLEEDGEMPGGGSRRTRVVRGRCVFLNRAGRGCLLHAFSVDHGLDYHDLKSIVDCLFPITFSDGALLPADEVVDESLVCTGTGPTLYRGLRGELEYYFGPEFVGVLDGIESKE